MRSAGVDPGAETPISQELLQWADIVFVFEAVHWQVLRQRFPDVYPLLYIECLEIPDEFGFMDPELIPVLCDKLIPHLGPPSEPAA